MTPSSDSAAGIIALVLFVLRELWNIYREKNKPKVDNAQAANTNAQAELSEAQAAKIKADIQRDVLAQAHTENKTLIERVGVLESALHETNKTLAGVMAELDQYKMGVGLLMGQLIKNNIKPTWTPPGVVAPEVKQGGLLK